MPISGTRRLMTGGWGSPKLDIKNPDFYVPFWRPDMVANGGAIVNGTGTMNVSPQALAVGANTITITAAGTLIVNIPEGGTVASGTMTVTGSPVTVSAGIATTITTTGATGNITVTPSNIIRSRDKNNLALTITGAVYGRQGRTFDGNDDYIIVASPTFLTDTQGYIELWVKATASAGEVFAFSKLSTAASEEMRIVPVTGSAGSRFLEFIMYDAGAVVQDLRTPFNSTVLDTWYHLVVQSNDTAISMFIDGVSQTLTALGGSSNTGDWFGSLVDEANQVTIGALARSNAYVGDFTGTLGEIRVYNQALSQAEITNHYQATKGRYQ